MSYSIERREEHHACVLHVDGDIDVAVVPTLKTALDQVIGTGCHNVVIDLERVAYADSSALGLLVWLDHQLQPRNGKAVLAGANHDVERVFELSGLLSVTGCIEESADIASAISCLESPQEACGLEWSHTIAMPAGIHQLAEIRERIAEMVRPLDFAESALFDIKVALGEALANAVRHGSKGRADAEISVVVSAYPDKVVFEVTDDGAGFDGVHRSSDDLYAIGGRGVMFMRALMDSVCFTSADGGGTTVRLVKHRVVGVTSVRE